MPANLLLAWRAVEGVSPETRQQISVNVTARDQVEFYSPPFEAAVKRGKTQSVMCSYNAVNGMPACLSSAMINDKLRAGLNSEIINIKII